MKRSQLLKSRNRRRAMTLIEVVIASSITLVIGVGTVYLLLAYAKISKGTLMQERLNSQGRIAMRQLQISIRSASETTVTNSGKDLALVRLGGVNEGFRIEDDGDFVYYEQGLDVGTAKTLLTDLASGSQFTLVTVAGDPAKVQIQFEISDPVTADGSQTFSIATTVANRMPAAS